MDDEWGIRLGISALWITHFTAVLAPSFVSMPIRPSRWILPVAALAVALTALTACTSPAHAPTPIATTKPVLENEEQALAAGTAAYQSYLDAWNSVVIDSGADPARIAAVTTGELTQFEMESLSALADLGWSFSGAVVLESFLVREWYLVPDAAGVLIVGSACVDLTSSQAVDADGVSVIRDDRPRMRTWDVQVVQGGPDQSEYVLAMHEVRKEGSSCEG